MILVAGKLKSQVVLLNSKIMLRKLLMAVTIFFITIAAKADDQKIASKVQKVIVFLNGAQVTRTAMVNVNAGTTELVFAGISPGLDVQSIQVHANGEFTILSVKHELNFLNKFLGRAITISINPPRGCFLSNTIEAA